MSIRRKPVKRANDSQPQSGTKHRCRINSATAVSREVRDSVIRLALNSELRIDSLRKVARYAGTNERQALDILRDHIYDLRIDARSAA